MLRLASAEVPLMPGHSPFVVDLPDQERDALEARACRYTTPHRDVIRAKIVLLAVLRSWPARRVCLLSQTVSPPPTRPPSARARRPTAPWARRPLGEQGPDLLPPGVGQQPTVSHHRPSFGRCVRFMILLPGLPPSQIYSFVQGLE